MLMGAYARWQALAADERRLTVKSAMVIGVAVVALRVLGVNRTLRMASRPVEGRALRLAPLARPSTSLGVTLSLSKGQDPAKIVIGEFVTAVDRAGRYVPGGTCLPKALALAWMLRGHGVAAAVSIGVKTAGQFEAHAWVECDGVAVENVPAGYAAILNR